MNNNINSNNMNNNNNNNNMKNIKSYKKFIDDTNPYFDLELDENGFPIEIEVYKGKIIDCFDHNIHEIVKSEIERLGNEADLNHLDVSAVIDMSELFANTDFNGDISNWNTENVVTMKAMFANANKFNGDISMWNTGNVKDMSYMFAYASEFNQKVWFDTSNVELMTGMFLRASKFNKSIFKFTFEKVTCMSYMFKDARAFTHHFTRGDSVICKKDMFLGTKTKKGMATFTDPKTGAIYTDNTCTHLLSVPKTVSVVNLVALTNVVTNASSFKMNIQTDKQPSNEVISGVQKVICNSIVQEKISRYNPKCNNEMLSSIPVFFFDIETYEKYCLDDSMPLGCYIKDRVIEGQWCKKAILICSERIAKYNEPNKLYKKVIIHEYAHAIMDGCDEVVAEKYKKFDKYMEESFANYIALRFLKYSNDDAYDYACDFVKNKQSDEYKLGGIIHEIDKLEDFIQPWSLYKAGIVLEYSPKAEEMKQWLEFVMEGEIFIRKNTQDLIDRYEKLFYGVGKYTIAPYIEYESEAEYNERCPSCGNILKK